DHHNEPGGRACVPDRSGDDLAWHPACLRLVLLGNEPPGPACQLLHRGTRFRWLPGLGSSCGPPDGSVMFATGFMMTACITATVVAVVAGVGGYFVVLRGEAFPAHAIPKGAFAGAAGAALIGVSTLLGLAIFALLGAVGIGSLGRRGRNDVATALTLVMMLALAAAFLSRT